MTSCSIPEARKLDCVDGTSVYSCKAEFSDGKSREIVFVDTPSPGQEALDTTTVRDDLGNEYCVTLYRNVTATFVAGACS